MAEEHVFISYARRDEVFVRGLLRQLKRLRLSTWRDIEKIRVGKDWRQEIDDALRRATVVVVIVSARSVSSSYVVYEWAFALGAGIRVIPLVLGKPRKDRIHLRLAAMQLLQFGSSRKPWLRLIDAIQAGDSDEKGRPRLHAEFEMEEGRPKGSGRGFVIDLHIEGAPSAATSVRYEAHHSSFRPRTWQERSPNDGFGTWIDSYGDVLISADIRTARRTIRVETTLYHALAETHGQDREAAVRKALNYIKDH